jgi:hypothetical protein
MKEDVYEKLNKMLNQHALASRPSEVFKPVAAPKISAPSIPKAPSRPKAPSLPKTPQEKASDFVERERASTEPRNTLLMPKPKI